MAASVAAFHTGLLVAGVFVMCGGVISLLGIVNPRAAADRPVADEPGAIRLAQPCPEGRVPAATSSPATVTAP